MAPVRYRQAMSNTRMHIDPYNLQTPAQFATWRRCQEIMAQAVTVGRDSLARPNFCQVTPAHSKERVEMVTPLEAGTFLYRRYDMLALRQPS